jgi:uncharacterized membrane protein required for colicin V production
MVWIIAFLCLGLVGAAGYYQGPVRAAFSFLGLVFGAVLAAPLSPLTSHLVRPLGLKHPAWQIFVPQILAFLIVLTIFKICGHMVHQKIAVYFKYKVDDRTLYRWERVYCRLGLCVGLLNGAVYFILLMVPVYAAGYFTTELGTAENEPAGVRFVTMVRAQLLALKLDNVLAPYDPIPAKAYQAADIADLILHNPLLKSRLGHYPPILELSERPEFKELANDVALQQMIDSQATIGDIIRYPKVQGMLTNATITADISRLIGKDLDDLQGFLMTGQSGTYDPETILGVWNIDRAATVAQLRKSQPAITPKQLLEKEQEMYPVIVGLTLTAMPDNEVILKKPHPNTSVSTVVATGTWKKDSDTYQVNLPGTLPETSEIEIENADRLFMPKFGYVLAFDKEM